MNHRPFSSPPPEPNSPETPSANLLIPHQRLPSLGGRASEAAERRLSQVLSTVMTRRPSFKLSSRSTAADCLTLWAHLRIYWAGPGNGQVQDRGLYAQILGIKEPWSASN